MANRYFGGPTQPAGDEGTHGHKRVQAQCIVTQPSAIHRIFLCSPRTGPSAPRETERRVVPRNSALCEPSIPIIATNES